MSRLSEFLGKDTKFYPVCKRFEQFFAIIRQNSVVTTRIFFIQGINEHYAILLMDENTKTLTLLHSQMIASGITTPTTA